MIEKVNFKTSDGVVIVGDYYKSSMNNAPAVILLHMMPATKESWKEFAEELQSENFSVLAIDLRGHGESLDKNEEKLDYKNFIEEEHRDSYKDVEAAVSFLQKQGNGRVALGGASIGANLAIWYQAEHSEIEASIPLSAGFDYKRIETESLVQKMGQDQGIYFVGAREDYRSDGSNCAEVAETLYEAKMGSKKIKVYEESDAHGTDLFEEDPELISELAEWLKNIYF